MSRIKSYRHLPAFVLLLLAREDLYGAAILNKMKTDMPHFFDTDLSVIYRLLQDLESIGTITYYWETDTTGPARKWYQITDLGFAQLMDYKSDIEKRLQNFNFFLEQFEIIIENHNQKSNSIASTDNTKK